jgi:hypothetical protein
VFLIRHLSNDGALSSVYGQILAAAVEDLWRAASELIWSALAKRSHRGAAMSLAPYVAFRWASCAGEVFHSFFVTLHYAICGIWKRIGV